jgi:hypothetical protein
MLKFIIALALVAGIHGGKVCLPKGWVLEWTFLDQEEIGFKLVLDAGTSENYGWVGIGFKYEEEAGVAMVGADITNIIFEDIFTDRIALTNGMPDEDVKCGGTDDNHMTTASYIDGIRTFSWVRPLSSGDQYDKEYIIGKEYKLLWATGDVINGIQMKHFTVDRDVTLITLDLEFSGGCPEEESSAEDEELFELI